MIAKCVISAEWNFDILLIYRTWVLNLAACFGPRRCPVFFAFPVMHVLEIRLLHRQFCSTIMQIVTGIDVNGEAYFPKLREYCPSAEGMRAIFPQLREIRLTIYWWWQSLCHYLFCYTSDRNGD